MTKHTILFLAANPLGTGRLALDEEARAIRAELERSGYRDRFEFVTRGAVRPMDLLRDLRKLKPTVVHFSGHGGHDEPRSGAGTSRDVIAGSGAVTGDQHGLYFQGPDGRPQFVSAEALKDTFGAAGSSVKVVVLNACYSEVQADALRVHVDCVVGMGGSIRDDAARRFAIGFYGGLGERTSVTVAYAQGRAAIVMEGLPDGERPQLKVRTGIDADRLILASRPSRTALGVLLTTSLALFTLPLVIDRNGHCGSSPLQFPALEVRICAHQTALYGSLNQYWIKGSVYIRNKGTSKTSLLVCECVEPGQEPETGDPRDIFVQPCERLASIPSCKGNRGEAKGPILVSKIYPGKAHNRMRFAQKERLWLTRSAVDGRSEIVPTDEIRPNAQDKFEFLVMVDEPGEYAVMFTSPIDEEEAKRMKNAGYSLPPSWPLRWDATTYVSVSDSMPTSNQSPASSDCN